MMYTTYNTATSKGKRNATLKISTDDDDDNENNTSSDTDHDITLVNNHLYFYAEVSRKTVFQLTALLRQAEAECIKRMHDFNLTELPIYLHISSFGGCLFNALTAVDVIQSCKVPVYTIIDGATASAGTLISIVGAKRFMRPNSYMLIHQLSSGFWGKMSELEDEHANNTSLMNKIKHMYKKYTTMPKKTINDILKHDLWWDYDTCLQNGLIEDEWTSA